MKKLQNNFTTPEQSKRLLELGVPAWTADCYYSKSGKKEIKNTALDEFYPACWSVGRLIELLCINDIFFDYGGCSYRRGYNIINYIISQLEAEDDLDFSELEE